MTATISTTTEPVRFQPPPLAGIMIEASEDSLITTVTFLAVVQRHLSLSPSLMGTAWRPYTRRLHR